MLFVCLFCKLLKLWGGCVFLNVVLEEVDDVLNLCQCYVGVGVGVFFVVFEDCVDMVGCIYQVVYFCIDWGENCDGEISECWFEG